jgi:hypothetical protein
MSEFITEQQASFGEVVDIFSNLVEPVLTLEDDGDREFEYTSFEGKFRDLELEPVVSDTASLGDRVNCEVVGDAYMGIAVVLRPRNPFSKERYGFFFQPEGEGSSFTVWHAPARKPDKPEWIGASLLDSEQVLQATPALANALVDSLRNRSAA